MGFYENGPNEKRDYSVKSDIKNQISKLRIIKKLFNVLSSKAFLLWLIGGWIVYYVLSSIWEKEAFGGFAAGINKNPLIQVPFVMFLISGYLNLIRGSKDVFKKRKIQFLAWLVLPVGTLLFLTGFFLSLYLRQSGQTILGEGDVISPPWVSETYKVADIKPGLRESLLDTAVDRGIFAHEPEITLLDKSMNSFKVGAFPPTKIDGTYYHILNFGIAPGIRLLQDGRIRSEGYMPLRILVLGSSDFFEIPPYPYRFLISLEPEKTFQKAELSVSMFNFKTPVYRIRVFKGEKLIAEGNSRRGIKFDDLALHFFDHTFWVSLKAARDPGRPVMLSGILLIAAGVPISLIRFLTGLFQKKS